MVVAPSSRSVTSVRQRVVCSLRCGTEGSRCDAGAVKSGAADRARYGATHFRMYIPPDPGRVLQLTGALGAQPVTPSEVL